MVTAWAILKVIPSGQPADLPPVTPLSALTTSLKHLVNSTVLRLRMAHGAYAAIIKDLAALEARAAYQAR
jgi:hypothetical protein